MIISLPERSEYYYTNIFIPISTDSTLLKVAKVSGLIFLGLVAFFVDCALKLAYRNIVQEKKPPNLSDLVKNTLDSTEKIQDIPIVEQMPTDKHSENLATQEKALGVEISSFVENTPASTETLAVLPGIEQVFTEMPIDKYSENLAEQDKAFDIELSSPVENALASTETLAAVSPIVEQIPTDKYSMSLAVQKKALAKYLNNTFQVTPKDFLQELKLFVAGESISFKFIPVFAKGPLPIHERLVKIIEALLKKHSNNELSKDYEEYTCALRDAINTKEYKNNEYVKLSLILQELCFAKFVSAILTDLQEKTLENMLKEFNLPRDMNNISKRIEEDNKALWKQVKRGVRQSVSLNWEKLRNATGINSDQLSSANIPELRSTHKVKQNSEEHSIYYIRYPTPTIQGLNSIDIAPEFREFLGYMQRNGISFLHVNHQYMDKKSKDPRHAADNKRAKTIQRLEDTHAKVFHFLSLPFDGSIISEIDIEKDLTQWKQNLVGNVIGEKEGFRLPKRFKKSDKKNKQEIGLLLDNLQNLYFPGKSELNKMERRVLLVIFYSYLKEYFKSKYQIRIMASVCKDNKDRGNVSACIDEALFNLRLGKENEQALKDLHLRILSPFIFRNEGIVPHRLKFLTDLLNHIAKLDDAQKKSVREFQVNEQYQIVDQWIPRSNEDIRI